jgi:hypothetical protein
MASWITDTKDLISAIGYVKLNLVKTGAKARRENRWGRMH